MYKFITKIYPWLLLTPLYLFLGIIFYWSYQSLTLFPTDVISKRIVNPEIHSGQNLFTEATFYRRQQCRINRIHMLVNDMKQIRVSNDDYYIFKEPLPVVIQNVVNIPYDVQPGEYDYVIQTTYFCNPVDYLFGRHRDVKYGTVTLLPPIPAVPTPAPPRPVPAPLKTETTPPKK